VPVNNKLFMKFIQIFVVFLYVQMELCERGTLKALAFQLQEQQISWPNSTLLRVLHDVSSALWHTHAHGYIHMDVKPSNILISFDGVLKLADFDRACRACTCAETCQCESVCVCACECDGREGDHRYMAPELLSGSHCHTAVDMFSLGLSLLELCARAIGELPSHGPEWHRLRRGDADVNGQHLHSCTVFFRKTVSQLLSPDPELRPSAQTVLESGEMEQLPDVDHILVSAIGPGNGPPTLARAPSVQEPSQRLETPTSMCVTSERGYHSGGENGDTGNTLDLPAAAHTERHSTSAGKRHQRKQQKHVSRMQTRAQSQSGRVLRPRHDAATQAHKARAQGC
jgi:serine/threonine protein kinase